MKKYEGSMNFSSVLTEKVLSYSPLYGGSIGKSFRVETEKSDYFIKYYSKVGLSSKEANGLNEIAKTDSIKVPNVINYNDNFLVLEFIHSKSALPDFQKILGRQLACMHKISKADAFGFFEDNYIGLSPQKNSFKDNWSDFFIQNRLGYQIEISKDRELSLLWKSLKIVIPEIIKEAEEPPSLIHGDLWGGNVMKDSEGAPVIVDPAAYYGHREMELGMTVLFGGFTSDFYNAYDSVYPLKVGWKKRLDLYTLYHVLNHFNMFGGSYKTQALSLMRACLKIV
ncbi:MAG: fructosamine kinase family protein [Spirochaetales bacterium]|nr:fructosamine kinase family protein [Spirochaetales bacterium]